MIGKINIWQCVRMVINQVDKDSFIHGCEYTSVPRFVECLLFFKKVCKDLFVESNIYLIYSSESKCTNSDVTNLIIGWLST